MKLQDTVAIALLVNPSTGQKLVDYLTLNRKQRLTPAHDFSLGDIELVLDRPQVTVAGKTHPIASPIGVAGNLIWLYVEGYGRYIFSLVPNETLGLRENGSVYSDYLMFRDRDTEFRVASKSAIAPGNGHYNLYVVSQPSWRPRSGSDPLRIGAASNLDSLTGAH